MLSISFIGYFGCKVKFGFHPRSQTTTYIHCNVCRLLRLIELPSLDRVLSQQAVDGRHIAHNVSLLGHREEGGACSSAAAAVTTAQTGLTSLTDPQATASTSGHASGSGSTPLIPRTRPLLPPPPPLAPASHVTRRRQSSSHQALSLHTRFQNQAQTFQSLFQNQFGRWDKGHRTHGKCVIWSYMSEP